MNVDCYIVEHRPVHIESNPNKDINGNRKCVDFYYCPVCNEKVEYKQKQCKCGNQLFWKFKRYNGQWYPIREE